MFSSPQINLYAADVAGSQAFYERLGFVEAFRTPQDGDPIHVEMRLDGFTLGLVAIESVRRDHHRPDATTDGGSVEVAVWTDDIDAAYDALLASGAGSLSEPHDWLTNLRVAWVADPDGNPVQLVQRRA